MRDEAVPEGVALRPASVIAVVCLTLLTGGIYTGIWYLRRRKGLNSLQSATKLGVAGPVILLALTIVFLVTPQGSTWEALVQLAAAVANIAMAFRVRWMIVDHQF